MWICLSDSFVSLVAHRDRPNMLMARARIEGDLERVFPGVRVLHTPEADYAYRAEVTREHAAVAVAQNVAGIDYPNFKDSVPEQDRHDAYLNFWHIMLRLQKSRMPDLTRRRRRAL